MNNVALMSVKKKEECVQSNGLGARIACARIKHGWSQDELASRVSGVMDHKIAQNQISNWELGLFTPKADVLRAIAVALACSADYLLGLQTVAEDVSTETETAIRLMERLPERDRWRCLEEIRKVYDEREAKKQEFERLGRALESLGGPELRQAIEADIGLRPQ